MSDLLDVAIAVRGGQQGWDEVYKLKTHFMAAAQSGT